MADEPIDPDVLEELRFLWVVNTSDEAAGWIRDAVSRLPEDVRRFVRDQCIFMSVGNGKHAETVPVVEILTSRTWLILIDENMPEADRHSIVAHEVAHAWRGCGKSDELRDGEELERQVREVARSWGFLGSGADEPSES